MKVLLFLLLFALVLIIPEGEVVGQTRFQETVTQAMTSRTVLSTESGEILFDEARPGHPGFDESTFEISFQHSLMQLEPVLWPNGQISTARLKLFLKQHGQDDIELAVDSLSFDKQSKRIVIAGEAGGESLVLEQTMFENGQLSISLSGEGQFVLFRSTLTIDYSPAEPMGVGSDPSQKPEEYALEGNYPNPFNPTTHIIFVLPVVARVTLEVFNVNGQHVKTLERSTMLPGRHTIEWDGTDSLGKTVVSGLYLYRLQAGQFMDTRKMILLK